MNIQGSNIVERRSVRKSDVSFRWVAAVSKGLLVLGCIGIMANTYIYFNQKISETDRQILQLKKELANVEREIDSYRLQYEKYSAWPYIREAISRFNLPLRPATPDQNRRLAMIPPSLAPTIAITFRDTAPQPAVSTVAHPVKTASVQRQARAVPNRNRIRQATQSRYPDFRYSRN